MIQNIEISRLYPHPDNPRKDLGDLTELAESIKANGVLQNLTVIPQEPGPGFCPSCNLYIHGVGKCKKSHDETERAPCTKWESAGNFTVVIGHRRLAAAKKAGLTEVPCAITEMDRKEQIATMLLENMQRADLTVFEQAQGIQMMMNLGDTVAGISEKTGFSESTVRRRVKLLELDGEKFKKATERGATLMDFTELEKIQSLELRNEVLETIGTKNFDYKLRSALDQEKTEANQALWAEALSKFATKVESEEDYRRVKHYYPNDKLEKLEIPDDADTVQYFFCISRWSVVLLKKDVSTAAERKIEDERNRMRECSAAIEEINGRAYKLRENFIRNFTAAKKHVQAIIKFWAKSELIGGYACFDHAFFAETMNLLDENGDYADPSFYAIQDQFKTNPERVFLVMAYCSFDDGPRLSYSQNRWNEWPHFGECERLDALYEMLEALGYQMSDEERALKDGTHELLHKGDQLHE